MELHPRIEYPNIVPNYSKVQNKYLNIKLFHIQKDKIHLHPSAKCAKARLYDPLLQEYSINKYSLIIDKDIKIS